MSALTMRMDACDEQDNNNRAEQCNACGVVKLLAPFRQAMGLSLRSIAREVPTHYYYHPNYHLAYDLIASLSLSVNYHSPHFNYIASLMMGHNSAVARWMAHVKILFPFDVKDAIDRDCLHIRRVEEAGDNTTIISSNSASFVVAYEDRKDGTNDKYNSLDMWCVSVLPEGRVLYTKLNGKGKRKSPSHIEVVRKQLKLTKRDQNLMMKMENKNMLRAPDDWVILKTEPNEVSDSLPICPTCKHPSFVAEYVSCV